MLLTEYKEKETMELFKQEGADDNSISNLKTIMRKMKMSAQKAMDFLEVPLEDQKRYAPLLKEHSEAYSVENG